MARYLVFVPNAPGVVEHSFPERYRLDEGMWAVRSSLATCSEVHEHLALGPDRAGVVIKITEYYGHYDRALWEKLESWSQT